MLEFIPAVEMAVPRPKVSSNTEGVGEAPNSLPPVLQLPLSSNGTARRTDQPLYELPIAMEQYEDPAAAALSLEHHENKHIVG